MDLYLGLGTNVGRLARNLEAALGELCRVGLEPLAVSSVWRTEPVDSPSPDWFWNMVVRSATDLPAEAVLDRLLAIERGLGRERAGRNAPRVIDLDLLMLGDRRVCSARLELPHPRMWGRRFVLAPLAEIAPGLRNPATGRTVVDELERLAAGADVQRLGRLEDCAPAAEGARGGGGAIAR